MSELFLNAMMGLSQGGGELLDKIETDKEKQRQRDLVDREMANKEEMQAEQITSLRESRKLATEDADMRRTLFDQGQEDIKANRPLVDEGRKAKLESLKPLAEQAETIWNRLNTGMPFPKVFKNHYTVLQMSRLDPNSVTVARHKTIGGVSDSSVSEGAKAEKALIDNIESLADVKIKFDGMMEGPDKVELQGLYQKAINSLNAPDATLTGGIGTVATITDKLNNYISKIEATQAAVKKHGGAGTSTEEAVLKAEEEARLKAEEEARLKAEGVAKQEQTFRELPENKPVVEKLTGRDAGKESQRVAAKLEASIKTEALKIMPVPPRGGDRMSVSRNKLVEDAIKSAKDLIPPGVIPTQTEITIAARKALKLVQNQL